MIEWFDDLILGMRFKSRDKHACARFSARLIDAGVG
jgi:hypothetical protein